MDSKGKTMARVAAVCSSKGGGCKSTTAAALAVEAARRGERVAILDLDPQASLEAWWQRRGEPDNPAVIPVHGSLQRLIDKLSSQGTTLVVIDTPPAIIRIITAAINHADLVVIPVRPSRLDLEGVEIMLELIDGERPYLFVVSAAPPQGSAGAQTAEMLAEAGDVAATVICQRAAHVRAMAKGLCGGELDSAAQSEIAALWREVDAKLPKVRT